MLSEKELLNKKELDKINSYINEREILTKYLEIVKDLKGDASVLISEETIEMIRLKNKFLTNIQDR